jgi:hypothetical protein
MQLSTTVGSDNTEQCCSDCDPNRLYCDGMDSDLSNSLEAIANLLHLIQKSLHNPAAATMYVGLAEDRMRAIAVLYGQGSAPEMLATELDHP